MTGKHRTLPRTLLLRRQYGLRYAVIAGAAAAGCCALQLPAVASATAAHTAAKATAATGPVLSTPATGTPTLAATGTTETVRQLVKCGGIMYAVGTFTEIAQNGVTTARSNIFSFRAASPFKVTSWAPDVNGTVNSIAFDGSNCADAYIGGQFTSVNGTTVANLAEISTTTGNVVPTFGSHTGGGHVDTILAVNGHLLVGGTFTSVNGNKGTDPYYASLNPVTGKDDGFLRLGISGHYVFPKVKTNGTEVYNQQLSHSGTLLLVEGDFTKVGGLGRQQIFMLHVNQTPAKVTGWSSPEFDGSKGNLPGGFAYQCGDSHPFYVHAAAWSPDDSTIYLADTGVHPWNWDGSFPMVGLCDAAAAFPANQKEVTHDWIAYDGCDSLYSAAADNGAVYVAGHNRWFHNQNACNTMGPSAIPAPGLAGLAPGATGGSLILNSSGTAGLYSRSRGHGADDMLLTSAGLWIASDNFGGKTSCGGVSGYAGICFLPYS
jgi:hypothetical protein